MNALTMVNKSNTETTMTSLELLKVINQYRNEDGKKELRHDSFMSKIKDELEDTEGLHKFLDTYINAQNGQKYPCYNLPKDECMLMAMRESKYVRRHTVDYIKQLESKNVVTLPNFNNPAESARAWADEVEAKQLALEEVKVKETLLIEQAPKVEFANAVNKADQNVISMKDAAKALGVGRNTMMSILRDENVLMKGNSPYQRYIDSGYFTVRQSENNGYLTSTTFVTGKGEVWLYKFLTKNGYL